MPNKENQILARELSKLGALGGIGGGVSGLIGGAAGASFVARMLPNDTVELVTEIDDEPQTVLEAAFQVVRQEGKILERASAPSKFPTVTGLIGSGIMNLNPAIVSIQMIPSQNNTTVVLIRGTAKEGLIKQHAGEKAAKRISDLLLRALASRA